MTALPVVVRELRVLSRRSSTYWMRFGMGLIAMLLSAYGFLVFETMTRWGRSSGWLFDDMVFVGGLFCLVSGLQQTSDCLSREKRDGTLGLLFLTDLKGYDVVLGKFAACGLIVFYCLIAVFPAMAISFLLGGVEGGEFWRSLLAMMNLLFFSLATSMLVSSFNMKAEQSLYSGLVLLFLLAIFPVILVEYLNGCDLETDLSFLAFISPIFPIEAARGSLQSQDGYWLSLGLTHLLAWLFLTLVSARLPWCWQETTRNWLTRWKERRFTRKHSNPALYDKERKRMLADNPFVWLVSRNHVNRFAACGYVMVALVGCVPLQLVGKAEGFGVWSSLFVLVVADLFTLGWKSVEAERHLSRMRRDGSLELLLNGTPISEASIINGQWQSLKRLFFWPVSLLILLHLGAIVESVIWKFQTREFAIVATVSILIVFLFCQWAMPWISMWRGYCVDKPGRGVISAFWFAGMVPLLGFLFLFLAVGIWLAGVLVLVLIFHYGYFSRQQLRLNLRKLATPPLPDTIGLCTRLIRGLVQMFR